MSGQATYQEAMQAAIDIFTEHTAGGCDACRKGGAYAILRHRNEQRDYACKMAGFPSAHSYLIREAVPHD